MANRIVLNETSYHGAGAVKEIPGEVNRRGLHKGKYHCRKPHGRKRSCIGYGGKKGHVK